MYRAKTKLGQLENFISDFFFQLKLFFFLFTFLNQYALIRLKVALILQEKITKFELSHQKIVLNDCSSILEFFLVHISILVS